MYYPPNVKKIFSVDVEKIMHINFIVYFDTNLTS